MIIMEANTDDDFGNSELRLRPSELLAFQRELKEEKELLQKMLAKIDNQIHALQVEQLHLLSIANKSLQDNEKKSVKNKQEEIVEEEESTNRTLDLTVPSTFGYSEEEEDDEADDIT